MGELGCFVRCIDTFKTSAGTLLTVPPRCRGEGWRIERSVDGLVLVEGPGRNDLVVWNPSIQKFHDISPSPTIEAPRNYDAYHYNLGLGYDPLVKDYKFVRLNLVRRGSLQSVEVYTLGGCSWKIIEFQGKESSDLHCCPVPLSNAIYLRGCFYFMSFNLNSDVYEMVYFDLSTDAFGSISLPPVFSTPFVKGKLPLLVDYGTSVALFRRCWRPDDTTMWAVLESSKTESVSLTWTNPCSLDKRVVEHLLLKKNIDMLLWMRDEGLFFQLVPYEDPGVYAYTQSLVLLN